MRKLVFSLLITCFFAYSAEADVKIGGTYKVTYKAGHKESQCHGTCRVWVDMFTGVHFFHLPCMGFGSDCEHTIEITVGTGRAADLSGNVVTMNSPYEATMSFVGLCTEPIFAMPARSIYVENEGVFINIPEQNSRMITGADGRITYSLHNVTVTSVSLYVN